MKSLFAIITAAGIAAALGGPAGAAEDADAGRKLAETVCAQCHGLDGNTGNAAFPKLAGQHADYLRKALEDYRSGARRNAIMAGFAATLSDADRRNLAAWYASQSGGVYTLERH